MNKTYIAIDLKSFYASVECVERGLDPMTTNLVVADSSRTEKTICLAVTPALKSLGVSGRARLFEVVQAVRNINNGRRSRVKGGKLKNKSYNIEQIRQDKEVEVDYLIAPPRMALYMDYSSRIYKIYLKYVAPSDIHSYSIDEVFIDATDYLKLYKLTAYDFAMKLIREVLSQTGITATAGIGTNLYLCKVAMDIEAKHIVADEYGVRIAQLDEMSYRKKLWNHTPITDFWRVGKGYATKLAQNGIYTMGDICKCSVGGQSSFYNEDLLYKLFGINAELLIDHAWGWEPCTIADIKSYKPQTTSISSGQVLQSAYTYEKAKIVIMEMAEALSLDLVGKKLVTDQVVLTVGYDVDNKNYKGEVTIDRYGRKIPKHAHGTINLSQKTSSSTIILQATSELFDRIIDKSLLVRRMNIVAVNTTLESENKQTCEVKQLDLFTDYEKEQSQNEQTKELLEKEKRRQQAVLQIKNKYGKNAILKGMNFEEGATAKDRNGQIGGHKA